MYRFWFSTNTAIVIWPFNKCDNSINCDSDKAYSIWSGHHTRKHHIAKYNLIVLQWRHPMFHFSSQTSCFWPNNISVTANMIITASCLITTTSSTWDTFQPSKALWMTTAFSRTYTWRCEFDALNRAAWVGSHCILLRICSYAEAAFLYLSVSLLHICRNACYHVRQRVSAPNNNSLSIL